jgi:NAD-dependent DNA ligase
MIGFMTSLAYLLFGEELVGKPFVQRLLDLFAGEAKSSEIRGRQVLRDADEQLEWDAKQGRHYVGDCERMVRVADVVLSYQVSTRCLRVGRRSELVCFWTAACFACPGRFHRALSEAQITFTSNCIHAASIASMPPARKASQKPAKGAPLDGYSVAASGKFPGGTTQSALAARVAELGGTFAAKVTADTSFLIATEKDYESSSTKVQAAAVHNVPVVTLDWLEDCESTGTTNPPNEVIDADV